MAGPHKPWADQPHSAAAYARIRRLSTLEDVHRETVALGTPLSVSQIHRMETDGSVVNINGA